MERRYLNLMDAKSALARGKAVECFLGRCERDGIAGVRWFALSWSGEGIRLAVFESADVGDEQHLDLYDFGPLDPELELDEPDDESIFGQFDEAIAEVDARFPGAKSKLVNEGIVQDEYADFIARGRRDA